MPTVARIIKRRRNRKARKDAADRRSGWWLTLIVGAPALLFSLPILGAIGLALWLYLQAASYFPALDELQGRQPANGPTRFFARDGMTIIHTPRDPLGGDPRWISLDDLPAAVVAAHLPLNYADLKQHSRFDPISTLAQIWRYMLGFDLEASSSLARDLARDALLPLARRSGLDEALLELALAAESQRRLSTDELVEWRLNTLYYGGDAFGIEAAARIHFGKAATALDLAEATWLAALSESPRLDPERDQGRLRERQTQRLDSLLARGLITKANFDDAAAARIEFGDASAQAASPVADFVAYARQQAGRILDAAGFDGARALARGGLRVVTTLDYDLFLQAECLTRTHLTGAGKLKRLDETDCVAAQALESTLADSDSPPDQAALVLLDARSGEILSVTGAALQQSHQPGVLLQPFVYMEGFLRRLVTPASMVYDIPQVYPGAADGLIYRPANPDGRYRGPLNLRDAMAAGLLPPAVQIANDAGMRSIIGTARRLGLSNLDPSRAGLELLERGGAVSTLDAAYAYATLAGMGIMRGIAAEAYAPGDRARDPVAIRSIHDADGNLIWEYAAADARGETSLIEPSLAYLVNDILSDADARNRTLDAAPLEHQRPTALLDALSADKSQSWTIAYTPRFSLAVHASRADGRAMDLDFEARAASAPIATTFMLDLAQRDSVSAADWQRPADIEEYLVCDISGLLPPQTGHCPTRLELLPAGSPLRRDAFWQRVEINSATGQLATITTPDSLRREETYFVPPAEIMEWWVENGKPLPPTVYATEPAAPTRLAELSQPSDFAYLAGSVEIRGRVNQAGRVDLLLEYGFGVNPIDWIEIARESERDAPLELSARWDASRLDGIVTIRLTARFADGRNESDTRQITLDNAKPLVSLSASDPRATQVYPVDSGITLLAEARDNLAIERVEFYQGADLLGIDRDWPYGFETTLARVGTVNFRAIAYDQVGNSGAADLSLTVVAAES